VSRSFSIKIEFMKIFFMIGFSMNHAPIDTVVHR
jgi:hypothetical protein